MDFAELGLMTGAADPMMNFPYGTTFTPYSVIRNISDQPATVTPTIWWMSGGTSHSARLGSLKVAPHRTLNLDAQALLGAAELKNFNGSVNLVLDTEAQFGALALAAGSVDQTKTYVFEVIPRAVGEGGSQALCYWSTANGDDTMVSLWNPPTKPRTLHSLYFIQAATTSTPFTWNLVSRMPSTSQRSSTPASPILKATSFPRRFSPAAPKSQA
jgi:hypothetical protein